MRRGLEEGAGGAAATGEGVVAAPPAWGRAAGEGGRSVHAWLLSPVGSRHGQRLPGLSGPRVAHRAAPLL